MQFALTTDHREYFRKNNYIELEEILSADQVAILKKNIETVLATRLRLPVAKLATRPASELFQAGYDLWRDNEAIKKTTQKNAFAALTSELLEIPKVRYAFDQYICTTGSPSPFPQPLTLQESSCLSPLIGALILPLEDLEQPLSFFPLPLKAGNGLYISPSLPIPWPQLFATSGLRFILIAFAMRRTLFLPDTCDPHAVNLKKLGYAFNEPLKDSLHPRLL